MKQVTVFGAVVVMAVSGMARADITPVPICTASGAQLPAIDGDWIVWHDAREGSSNNNIFGYILSEPNEVVICDVGGNQRYPSVGGNVAVWQDERDGQMDIYAFDLLEREPLALPGMPNKDNINQRYPKISGDLILYEQDMGSSGFNVFVYDMTPGITERGSASAVNQGNSAIDGTIVVWAQNNRIYWRDLATQNPAAPVNDSGQSQLFPAVGGGWILWIEAGDCWDVYGYNIAEDAVSVVVGGPGDQNRVAISGSIVVYQETPTGYSNSDIRAVDIDSGAEYAIAVNSAFKDRFPSISGRRIVWERSANQTGVYLAELPTPTTLEVDAPAAGETFLAGKAMEIMWYLVEGNAPATVKIDYSTDGGVSWQPVQGAESVPFADEYYLWEPIADVDSQTFRVRISDTAPGSSASAMSGAFTVFQCDPALTADLTGDCRVDIADFAVMAAQWLTSGNPYDPTW